ncbi:MAG: Type 1 glutamine amidotransferase-like domain-containing protein [Candidatus Wallbacteria bacterium]|nr:Type 1 glutamine amidotransferase-like domain-containing protein [Candidatus Wallbacteria bacterium]
MPGRSKAIGHLEEYGRRDRGTPVKGWIVFNGNIVLDVDFVHRQADRILESHHVDPEVRDWRKVLLITAGWQRDEFDEAHLKRALTEIGIPSRFERGFDLNIQNLAVYHEFDAFKNSEPEIYRQYHDKQRIILKTKELYRLKNNDFLRILREQIQYVKNMYPGVTLAELLAYDVSHHQADLRKLAERELLFHYCCQEVQDTLSSIVANDEKMIAICGEIDRYFRSRSLVDECRTFIQIRDALRRRILSANSIFLFGGHVAVLLNRLQFFRLTDVFHEALWRGTNFYSVSAGSMVLADKIIVYDDFGAAGQEQPHREFEYFDKGVGLVTRVALFPHCMDRIQTDDPDNLSYLAHRFSSGLCVGLNQESFLLAETCRDETSGQVRERFVSQGTEDGVYVFDRNGNKRCYSNGEEVPVS